MSMTARSVIPWGSDFQGQGRPYLQKRPPVVGILGLKVGGAPSSQFNMAALFIAVPYTVYWPIDLF